ncbi:MAG: hypothetical protein AAGA96_06860 [Verrucomicrobiota bacterium]
MNNESDSDPTPNEGNSAQENPESRPFNDFSKSVQDAFATGKQDARRAYDETMPRVCEEISRGVRELAYALSFATAFGAEVIRDVTPDNVKEGAREGSEAGQTAAKKMMRNRSTPDSSPGEEKVAV